MCWSFEVSIVSWLVSVGVGLYLFNRNKPDDRTFALLILVYGSMQLWEALMWLDQKCGGMNKFGTIAAYIALWSHVLAVGTGIFIEKKKTFINAIPMMIGVAFLVAAYFLRPKKWGCSRPGENCHLQWGFDDSYYTYVFVTCLAMCLIYIRPFWKAAFVCGIFLLSFFLSTLYAGKATGSFWCWITVVYCPIFIFLPTK